MSRVYIHEFVDVIGTERARYQHHMTANWCPEAGPLRRQRCFGVFSVVGSTGRWPQVVNLWEYDSWDDLAHNFEVELVGTGHRDPMLERWWERAADFRTGGHDRILVAHEASPDIGHWQDRGGTGAVAYLHEVLRTPVGHASEVCDAIAGPVAERYSVRGLDLVGLFRTAMRADDEVVVIWALPDWSTWAEFEATASAPAGTPEPSAPVGSDGPTAPTAPGGSLLDGLIVSLERVLLVDAALSPLRIGRQPASSDRRSLDEF